MRPIRPHPPRHNRPIKPRQPPLPRPIRRRPQPPHLLLRRLARWRRGAATGYGILGERGRAGVGRGWVEGFCGVRGGGGEARGVAGGACHCCRFARVRVRVGCEVVGLLER